MKDFIRNHRTRMATKLLTLVLKLDYYYWKPQN